MNQLLEIRKEIDKIDADISALFERRIALSCRVADYKIKNKMDVFDKTREDSKKQTLRESADDPFMSQALVELFSQIMSISKKKQYRILAEAGLTWKNDFKCVKRFNTENATVVYQGVAGAYAQAAEEAFFGKKVKKVYNVSTWRDAMEALDSRDADYAVIPLENSTAGYVDQNYDLLGEYDFAITGEQVIDIDHALLGLPGAELSGIKKVYSHPQALFQCDGFLREHPQIETESLLNTAVSAKKVKDDNDPAQAAIAGEINAQLYGLEIIERRIQDQKNNRTRFVILKKDHEFKADAGKVSVTFGLPHESGSLYYALSHIIFNGLNMTRIESRPVKGSQWEYRFFIDFEGNLLDEAVINALRGLSEETLGFRILGNF